MIKLIKVRGIFVGCIFLLLTACAGMATSGFNKSNTVGRDVDQVIAEIQKKGLRCGKYKDKEVFTNKIIGGVRCGIKEKYPICPKNYFIYMGYDLSTNLVTDIGKDERDNCF